MTPNDVIGLCDWIYVHAAGAVFFELTFAIHTQS